MLSKRLRKVAIIVTFLPLAGYVIYAIIVLTGVLERFDIYLTIQTFGMAWCFFAIIFALIALWFHKIGSVLIIFAGVIFFVSVLLTNHYPGRHLPLSGIYTIGGILQFINAFFLEKGAHPEGGRGRVSSLKKAAIIVSFLPLVGFVIYQALRPAPIFGIVWCFFAAVFAFVAIWYHRTGSILIILAGVIFFVSVWATNHYIEFYLPVSGVYTIGGILHFINAFFLERRRHS